MFSVLFDAVITLVEIAGLLDIAWWPRRKKPAPISDP